MNADAKKAVLRMIPYGIYVLTADDGKGNIAAATVNWVTQTAFAPPLVVVGVKTDSGAYQVVKAAEDLRPQHAGQGAQGPRLHLLQAGRAWPTARSAARPIRKGTTGAPILEAAPARSSARSRSIVEQGDHHIVVGEVVEAHLPKPFTGRPDAAILEMKELGDNVFYGG